MDIKSEAPNSSEQSQSDHTKPSSEQPKKVSSQKRTHTFRNAWMAQKDPNGNLISEWCKLTIEPHIVECIWCKTNLNFATKGLTAIKQHAQMAKHKQRRELALHTTSTSLPKRERLITTPKLPASESLFDSFQIPTFDLLMTSKSNETNCGEGSSKAKSRLEDRKSDLVKEGPSTNSGGECFDISKNISYDTTSFGNQNCYVCNFPLHISRYQLGTSTKHTKTPVHEFLESFSGTTLTEEAKAKSEICFDCFLTIEKFDELQQQCEIIQIRMANLLYKTHSETIYVKQEPKDSSSEADEEENDDSHGTLGSLDSSDGDNKKPSMDPKSFNCELCRRRFKTSNCLQVHLASDHGRNDGPIDCPICLKAVKDRKALRSHLNSHTTERNHLCGRCGATFTHVRSLNVHMMAHDGIRPFACEFPGCDKRFRDSGRLKRHHRVHTGEKIFECPQCPGKKFAQKYGMDLHIRSQHLTGRESRPFPCQFPGCNKSFTESGQRKRHHIVHTGIKMFQCPHCPDKKFAQKWGMDLHIKNHHKSALESSGTRGVKAQAVGNHLTKVGETEIKVESNQQAYESSKVFLEKSLR